MADYLDPLAVPYTPAGFRALGVNPASSPATLARWRLTGIRGHRILTFMRGGRRYVTPQAVRDFFAATSSKDEPDTECPYRQPHERAPADSPMPSVANALEEELDLEGL